MPEETRATPRPEATKASCAMTLLTSRAACGRKPAARQAATMPSK